MFPHWICWKHHVLTPRHLCFTFSMTFYSVCKWPCFKLSGNIKKGLLCLQIKIKMKIVCTPHSLKMVDYYSELRLVARNSNNAYRFFTTIRIHTNKTLIYSTVMTLSCVSLCLRTSRLCNRVSPSTRPRKCSRSPPPPSRTSSSPSQMSASSA